MATVGNSNDRRPRPVPHSKPTSTVQSKELDDLLETPRRRPRRKLAFVLLGMLVLCVVAVALGPTIIAKTALRDQVLNSALGINGEIDTARGSLGWFLPVVLEDVAIFDTKEQTVLQVASLTTSKTLLGLITGASKPGTFTINQPVVYVQLREKGSNLEDVLAPLLQGKGESKTEAVSVKITDGTVHLHDMVSNHKYQLQKVNVDLTMDKQASPPIELDVSAALPSGRDVAKIDLALRGGDAAGGLEQGMLDCVVEQFPLDVVAPFLRRALPGAQLAGQLNVNAHGTWGDGKDRGGMSLQGKLQADGFKLAADALGKDQLVLDRIELPLELEKQGSELFARKLSLNTDVGQAAIEGSVLIDELNSAALASAIQSRAYRAEAKINLAKLAALLPNTLHVKDGTRITDGTLQAVLVTDQKREGMAWNGRVETTHLRATAAGKRIDWQDPLVIEVSAHQSVNGPVVDRAVCTSKFLTLEGAGTLDDLQGNGTFDLATLVSELEQFVDLGGLELGGAGSAKFRLQRKAQDAFAWRSDLNATNFALAVPGKRALRERSLAAQFDVDGHLEKSSAGWQLASIEKSQLSITAAAGEQLIVQLVQPVEKFSSPIVPLQIDWKGPLAVWLPRIDPWVSTIDWRLDGNGNLQATAIYTREGIDVRSAKLTAQPLRWTGAGVFIDERQAMANLQAKIDSFAGRVTIPSAALEAGPTVVSLSNTEVRVPTGGAPSMDGTLRFDADLAQLNAWTQDPQQPATRIMSGKLSGTAVANRSGRTTSAKLDARIDNFDLRENSFLANPQISGVPVSLPRSVRDSRPRGWQERQLTLTATANYAETDNLITIDRAEISSDALRTFISGKIIDPATTCNLDLAGTIDYDWQTLAPFWRPYLGEQVNIVGRESRKFTFRGPLPKSTDTLAAKLAPITADAGIGWQSATAYGLPIGTGQIVAQLNRGIVNVQPINVPISEGQFTLTPRFELTKEPALMRLAQGPLLSQIRLTPEITEQFLKYAAPVLADTAKIEGQFSIDLDGGLVPLDVPANGDIGGRMIVHNVNVMPGPLAQQLLALGKQVEDILNGRPPILGQTVDTTSSLLTIKDQQFGVRMVERRVYHDGLQFTAGKIPIRTVGSVGFDETLHMQATISVPADGIGKGPLVNAIKGKTFDIPISGTLSKPKLDDRAITSLSKQMLENVGKGLILDEVGKQLDRFLPRQ